MSGRECGSCSACCTVIGVHELEKSTYETCKHVRTAGCGIYADRPRSCQTFECQWLRGVLEVGEEVDIELRPDACGVIFDYQPGTSFGDVFTAWEVDAGASTRGKARSIIQGLEERFLVMVVARDPDGEPGPGVRSFVGPAHLVATARHGVNG